MKRRTFLIGLTASMDFSGVAPASSAKPYLKRPEILPKLGTIFPPEEIKKIQASLGAEWPAAMIARQQYFSKIPGLIQNDESMLNFLKLAIHQDYSEGRIVCCAHSMMSEHEAWLLWYQAI